MKFLNSNTVTQPTINMKKRIILLAAMSATLLLAALNFRSDDSSSRLVGAWQTSQGVNETTLICTEKFFSVAIYDLEDKQFVGTYGGRYRLDGNSYIATIEFHSLNPETVGNEFTGRFTLQNGRLTLEENSGSTVYQRLDDGTPGKLAGAWLITGRMRDGQMSKMTPGARRTMKILSGTRFQWIAYNVESGEFSGTGGGTYTTRGGKYTEKIEFFSRDNSRVGASLTFDFSIEGDSWRHKGSSSTGQPIDEVWTRREKIGL